MDIFKVFLVKYANSFVLLDYVVNVFRFSGLIFMIQGHLPNTGETISFPWGQGSNSELNSTMAKSQ